MSDNIIETKGLTVSYGNRRGIKDVNLSVEKGEIFGFLGPNGAGKTTTQRVLLDIIRPVTGTATLFGLDTRKDGVKARQRIGYVPGELNLPPQMKGRQYLNMLDGVRPKKADTTYRRKLIARFDLDVTKRIKAYSRGNKQKLALIAAFMAKPELLILDEPTGGLDPLMQQAVIDTVREAKADGRTVFFSSHVLPEVQAVTDRVAVIKDGEIVATERIGDLLKKRSHRVRLTFANEITEDTFRSDQVKIVAQSPYSVKVEIFSGLENFMATAAPYGITDIQTDELSLEEAFMSFYGHRGKSDSSAS